MKQLYIIILLIALTSCGGMRAIYGVPEDKWVTMTESERQAAIERFEQEQIINAQTREQAEKAKQEAEEFERQCHEDEEKCRVITRQRWGF